LAYARWHLAWSEQWADNGQQRAALLESAIWHAVGAYRAFLGEIASDVYMAVDPDLVDTVSAASLRGAYCDYLPAALAECTELEGRAGWLQDLLCWSELASRSVEEPGSATGLDVISTSASSAQALPEYPRMVQCLDHLEALIDRLRGDMLEC
jgi:hypothetical protein